MTENEDSFMSIENKKPKSKNIIRNIVTSNKLNQDQSDALQNNNQTINNNSNLNISAINSVPNANDASNNSMFSEMLDMSQLFSNDYNNTNKSKTSCNLGIIEPEQNIGRAKNSIKNANSS